MTHYVLVETLKELFCSELVLRGVKNADRDRAFLRRKYYERFCSIQPRHARVKDKWKRKHHHISIWDQKIEEGYFSVRVMTGVHWSPSQALFIILTKRNMLSCHIST